MTGLAAILRTRFTFGTTPDTVPVSLGRNALVLLALSPGVFVAALTQLAAPFGPFRGEFGPGVMLMSYLGTGIMTAFALAVMGLIWTRRAAGVVPGFLSLLYFSFITSALMIAVMPIGSLSLLIGTVLLAGWSVFGLLNVNRRVQDATLRAVRAQRLFVKEGTTYLLPASALGGKDCLATNAVRGLRNGYAVFLEFIGALAVIGVGGFLVPVAIATDFGSQGLIAPILWFFSVSMFLVVRGVLNVHLVVARAMAAGPVHEP
ncbi:hypothetical protein [uncultured Tateyamaria sp.]|uniref:hypothetical protein n=1 Tax=Tateyamaria sp. 1078 TaxID=3417464 RepID=UPI00260B5B26|nr:hypothetical protein [uncultured Tateyamaria sp.]